MRYLSIKNLAEHQHYKDRNPPWIKLHAKILSNYEFGCLQDASKAHLMLLWVLASRLDNRIPYDLAWITKQLGATEPVDVEELVLQGFIEVSQDDGKTLASRKQSATPETETEKRQRKRKPSGSGEPDIGGRKSWPVEASELWSDKVTPITPGRCGGTLKAVVDRFGWDATRAGLEKYIIGTPDNRVRDLVVFSKEANRWVGYGGMSNLDGEGNLTAWGEHLRSISRRVS